MEKPVRILHCVVGMNRGGIEGLLMNIYRLIDKTKVQFDFLVSLDGIYDDEIKSLGGKIYKMPFISEVGPFKYEKNLTCFFYEHKEYTAVHAHMDKFGGAVMKCAKNANVPFRIVHSHNIKNEGNFIIKAVKNYYGRFVKHSTHFFACSSEAAKWMFPRHYQKAVIIKNGIIASKFSAEDNRDKNLFTICNIARFSQQKNHGFLIEIFSELYKQDNTSRLVLAGTGELMPQIKAKAKALGVLPYITFLGDVENVQKLLTTVDVFCLPSLFEGLGIVLIEAQAAGVKCVASAEVPAESNVSGEVLYLPLTLSPQQWAAEILKLKNSLRTNNIQKIIDKGYDISSSTKQLEEFYLNLLN